MESKKKTLAVLFISTGDYNILFNDYYKSFNEHFCKECDVTFFVFTDTPKIAENLDNCIVYNIEHHENTNRRWFLFRKFKYLMYAENLLKDYDYICYTNANMRCLKDVSLDELLCNHNYAAAVNSYDNSQNYRNVNTTYYTYTNAQYTAKYKRPYVLATFIIAKSRQFLKLANTIEGWRCLDKAIGNDVLVTNHDEAYFNRYVDEHFSEFNILSGKKYLCWETNFPNVKDARKIVLICKVNAFATIHKKIQSNNSTDAYLLSIDD